MNRRLIAVLAALIAVCPAGRAANGADDVTRTPLAAADIPAPSASWYGIYMNGTKIGYMHQQFGRSGDGPSSVYFSDQTGTLKLTSMQKTVELELSERTEFDAAPPFAFRRGRSSTRQGSAGQVIDVVRTADGLTATIEEKGATRTLSAPAADYTLADSLSSDRWIQAGRAVGDTAKFRTFRLEKLEVDVRTYTVTSRKESLAAGVRTTFYEVKSVSAKRGSESMNTIDSDGRLLSISFGGVFEGRLESEETAKRTEESSDLFVFGMVKVDGAVGDPRKVKRLILEVSGEGAAKLTDAPRQRVFRDEKTGVVTLSLGTETATETTVPDADAKEATSETVRYPITLPQVAELAAQAIGDAKTPREKAERLVRFVSDFVKDEMRPELLSVQDIIASRRGDCTEHALLFAALARAAGLPAREVSGLMYMGDDVKAFGGHAWDEVVLDGRWVPMDPAWNQVEVDAAHITLERGDKGMGVLATMGRLQFHLKDVVRAP